MKEALQHGFLLREILSLTSLHLSRTAESPSKATEYLVKAAIHQDLALSEFRTVLNQVDANNCQAVFTFSAIIALHSFASPRIPLTQNGDDDLEGILNNIQLVRGIDVGLQSWWDTIRLTETSQLVDSLHNKISHGSSDLFRRSNEIPVISFPEANVLEDLLQFYSAVPDPEAASAYTHAIKELRSTFMDFFDPDGCSTIAITCLWLSSISEVYITLLKEKKPEALLIMAYYAVLLHRHERFWYLEGWGEYLVQVVGMQMGPGWDEYLEWPRRMVGLEVLDISMA